MLKPTGPNLGYVMRKLPHVTLLFWILKIVAVTLGETAGDFLGITLKIGYVVTAFIFLAFFLIVVVAQVRAKTVLSGPVLDGGPGHQHGRYRDLGLP
jgi:uncharacterized membrane-anchored protein